MLEIKRKDIQGVELQTPIKREKELEGSLRQAKTQHEFVPQLFSKARLN